LSGDEWFKDYVKTFPATELKPYAEPVMPEQTQKGRVYFGLHFLDDDFLVPTLQPLIFLGCLDSDDPSRRFFQDFDSFRAGVRFSTRSDEDSRHFEVYGPDEGNHIFEYEHALEGLMRCALQRRQAIDMDDRILREAKQSETPEIT
jgi:hypothetical protein